MADPSQPGISGCNLRVILHQDAPALATPFILNLAKDECNCVWATDNTFNLASPDRVTIQETGSYQIAAYPQAAFYSNANFSGGLLSPLNLLKNGSVLATASAYPDAGGVLREYHVGGPVIVLVASLSAGDYLQLQIPSTPAGANSFSAGQNYFSGNIPATLTVARIFNPGSSQSSPTVNINPNTFGQTSVTVAVSGLYYVLANINTGGQTSSNHQILHLYRGPFPSELCDEHYDSDIGNVSVTAVIWVNAGQLITAAASIGSVSSAATLSFSYQLISQPGTIAAGCGSNAPVPPPPLQFPYQPGLFQVNDIIAGSGPDS